MPDLLAELRLPRPIPESSASEEALAGDLGSDSEQDQGVALDAVLGREPPSDNELDLGSEGLTPEYAASTPSGETENAVAVATSPDQVDAGSHDCAPVFVVTFSSGGVEPKEDDLLGKMKTLADWLRRYPAAKIFLEGHTDGVGDEEYNLVLSHRRARAVADLLAQAGAPRAQLSTRAYGESMLADPQPRSSRNRRVSMRVMDGNECPSKAEDHEG
jgi:outer membrane protein OmpA-like peptidoglycan-associated protein